MATDTEIIKDELTGKFATPLASNINARTEIAKVFTDVYTLGKAVDSTDSTTTAATAIPPVAARYAGIVKSVFLLVPSAVTGSATNNATLTLKAYPAAGVTGVTVATLTTTASITAFTRTAMTLATTAANLSVVAGGLFSLEIAKGASGVTLPALNVQAFVERT